MKTCFHLRERNKSVFFFLHYFSHCNFLHHRCDYTKVTSYNYNATLSEFRLSSQCHACASLYLIIASVYLNATFTMATLYVIILTSYLIYATVSHISDRIVISQNVTIYHTLSDCFNFILYNRSFMSHFNSCNVFSQF